MINGVQQLKLKQFDWITHLHICGMWSIFSLSTFLRRNDVWKTFLPHLKTSCFVFPLLDCFGRRWGPALSPLNPSRVSIANVALAHTHIYMIYYKILIFHSYKHKSKQTHGYFFVFDYRGTQKGSWLCWHKQLVKHFRKGWIFQNPLKSLLLKLRPRRWIHTLLCWRKTYMSVAKRFFFSCVDRYNNNDICYEYVIGYVLIDARDS